MTTTVPQAALPLAPGRWAIDHNHSSVGFTVRHLGVAKVRGRFERFDAEVVIGATLDETSVAATIDLASLDTANADRDAHVRSPEMLHVELRPTLTFRSTRISGADADWLVYGDATIGEITRPLLLTVEFGGIETFPRGGRHAGFEAKGELRRSDYGLDFGLPKGVGGAMLSDAVKLEIDVELIEPEAP
jgi:polyisoprenoid-binding protein YceI